MSGKPYNSIIVDVRDKIFKITLNRPEKKNAVNNEMYFEIIRALEQAADDKNTLLTVFTGNGDYYCSGTDLTEHKQADKEYEKMADERLRSYVAHYIDHPKPLVALVNGPVIGIGTTVLGLFDLVYASDKATFSTPFTSLGLAPEGCSSYTFPKIMGTSKAANMLLFGKKLSAEEAYQCGFVTEVFSPEKFVTDTSKRLKQFANLPPQSVMQSKKLIRDHDREQLHKTNNAECDVLKIRWQSEELLQAAMKYFQAKSKI